jgi:SAM-dependent methyltransferase
MKTFWDTRYSTIDHVYGRKPNGFFASQLKNLVPGRILLPGEGEGRNAVYAALQGWSVDAFDQSGVAKEKALKLAAEKEVKINYHVCPLEDFQFQSDHYDAAGLIFFHAEGSSRQYLHRKVYDSLKPGGLLILEAFHKEQLNNDSGGPKSLELLFDEGELSLDFAPFETRMLEKREILLNEGEFHRGESTVIRFAGKK